MTISPSETAVATRASCWLKATDARSSQEEPPLAAGAAPASARQTFGAASTAPAEPASVVPASAVPASAGAEASMEAPAEPLQQTWREQKAWASPVTKAPVVVR